MVFIAKDPKNAEVLFPYLNGDDLNSDPEQKTSRWVINFFDWPLDRDADGSWITANEQRKNEYLKNGHVPTDYSGRVVSDFPDLLEWITVKVKPEREEKSAQHSYRNIMSMWWKHWNMRQGLYSAIGYENKFANKLSRFYNQHKSYSKILVVARVSKTVAFTFVSAKTVFSDVVVVFTTDCYKKFAIMQSCFHIAYAWQHSSKMKTDLRYSPTDVFETFPFPCDHKVQDSLDGLAETFYLLRKKVMSEKVIGLTKFYKLYNDAKNNSTDIMQARSLQKQIDEAVRDAYGWNDIDLEHGFHAVSHLPDNDNIRYTISEPARIEILRRLAQLNRQRWQEEQEAKK